MRESEGLPTFPVWLVGDSPPKEWHDKLEWPLDRRHPARHNIWTPVLDVIQRTVFPCGLRLDDERLYVRNAVNSPELIDPERKTWKWDALVPSVELLSELFNAHKPKLVLTFGGFACELVRRALRKGQLRPPDQDRAVGYWTARQLAASFREGRSQFDPATVNHLPLLHVSISRGSFLIAHEHFCPPSTEQPPDYFTYVGTEIGRLLLDHLKGAPIWMQSGSRAADGSIAAGE